MKRKNVKSQNGPKPKPKSSIMTRQLLKTMLREKVAARILQREAICTTRTMELAGTENEEDRNKLLFLLALGLTPKSDKVTCAPVVRMEKLSSAKEVKQKADTKQRKNHWAQSVTDELAPTPVVEQPSPPKQVDIEVIDLVSSDDESSTDAETESGTEPLALSPANAPNFNLVPNPFYEHSPSKITVTDLKPRPTKAKSTPSTSSSSNVVNLVLQPLSIPTLPTNMDIFEVTSEETPMISFEELADQFLMETKQALN